MKMICIECAEINGGEWRPENFPTAMVGTCDCCKKLAVVIHSENWKKLGFITEWKKGGVDYSFQDAQVAQIPQDPEIVPRGKPGRPRKVDSL